MVAGFFSSRPLFALQLVEASVGRRAALAPAGEAGEEPRLLLAGWRVHFFWPALQLHGCSSRMFFTGTGRHWCPGSSWSLRERRSPSLFLSSRNHEARSVLQVEMKRGTGQGEAVLGGLGIGSSSPPPPPPRPRESPGSSSSSSGAAAPRPLRLPPGWRGQLEPPLPVLGRRLCPAGGTRGGRLAGFSSGAAPRSCESWSRRDVPAALKRPRRR